MLAREYPQRLVQNLQLGPDRIGTDHAHDSNQDQKHASHNRFPLNSIFVTQSPLKNLLEVVYIELANIKFARIPVGLKMKTIVFTCLKQVFFYTIRLKLPLLSLFFILNPQQKVLD